MYYHQCPVRTFHSVKDWMKKLDWTYFDLFVAREDDSGQRAGGGGGEQELCQGEQQKRIQSLFSISHWSHSHYISLDFFHLSKQLWPQYPGEENSTWLLRLSHLHCQNQGITKIADLTMCCNITVCIHGSTWTSSVISLIGFVSLQQQDTDDGSPGVCPKHWASLPSSIFLLIS